MGMYLDKYTCYALNVYDEIHELYKNSEKWNDFFETYIIDDNPIPDVLKALKLKTRYDDDGLDKDDAEILIDCVSDEFAYIIIILDVERWSDDYSTENEAVLKAMAQMPVEKDISDRIYKIYEILFGKTTNKPVFLTKVNHYH